MGLFWKKASKDEKQQEATLDEGLKKTKMGIFDKLSRAVMGKSKVDEDTLDDIEEALINYSVYQAIIDMKGPQITSSSQMVDYQDAAGTELNEEKYLEKYSHVDHSAEIIYVDAGEIAQFEIEVEGGAADPMSTFTATAGYNKYLETCELSRVSHRNDGNLN